MKKLILAFIISIFSIQTAQPFFRFATIGRHSFARSLPGQRFYSTKKTDLSTLEKKVAIISKLLCNHDIQKSIEIERYLKITKRIIDAQKKLEKAKCLKKD